MTGFSRFLPTTAAFIVSAAMVISGPALLAHAARPAMRLTVLPSSGPHIIAAKTLVTFHLRVTGIVLDPKHIGKAPISDHGHVQIYLDRIPADATKRMDMKGIVSVVGTSSFSVGFTSPWFRRHGGHHTFLLALARNDDVLYDVRPASFAVTVK